MLDQPCQGLGGPTRSTKAPNKPDTGDLSLDFTVLKSYVIFRFRGGH